MVRVLRRSVDALNEWTGKVAAWLIIPLTLIVVLDVILRYVFNKPTIWAWDVNVQLLGALVILGAGYCLLHNAHVGVDVLVLRFSPRKRAIIDLITGLFFVFAIGVLLWKTASAAWASLQIREAYSSYWEPPIYPFKMLMVVGILLLLLQGIAKFIRDLGVVIYPGREHRP